MLTGSVEATIAIVFAVVALGPILSERFRIPGIVGLIAGGVVFGPFVLGWLESDGLVEDLGSIGILYLMFLAGLSFDLRGFAANRRMAVTYGLLGFMIPFVIAVPVSAGIDGVQNLGALLIGAMWASNTLVAYPEVQAAGLQSTRSVGAAVSAGVVADLLSLTVMAFATSTAVIEIEPIDIPVLGPIAKELVPDGVRPTTPDPALPLWIGLPLLVVVCLVVLPRVADWFFVRVGRTRPQRVVFTLALMGAGSMVALLGGMEGLIGAFLTGLGMNRLVPTRGPLMERLDFTGMTIFVPVFLVSVGLSIDPVLLIDPQTIGIGLLFTGFVLVGKTTAAVVTGLTNRLTIDEMGLMSSLSFGQAASTLAIAEVGSSLGMFGQKVVNAAVLAIVITAFITSYATRFFARRVPAPEQERPPVGDQILLDTRRAGSDPSTLVAFAAALARADDGVVRPFAVSSGSQQDFARDSVDRVAADAAGLGLDAEGLVRVDDSFVDAAVSLVAETGASSVVLDWDGPHWAKDYLLGNDIDGVGGESPVPTVAAHLPRPWSRVVVALGEPSTAWQLEDAELALRIAAAARAAEELPVVVISDEPEPVAALIDGHLESDTVRIFEPSSARDTLLHELGAGDLVVVPADVVRALPPLRKRRLARVLQGANVVIVGGPHRLTVSSARRSLSPTIGTGPA